MGLTLFTISGVSRLTMVQPRTLSVSDELNNINTMSVTLLDKTGSTYRPVIGEPVHVQWDGTTIFAGTIDDIDERQVNNLTDCWYDLRVTDWNQRAQMNLVAAEYINQTLREIVEDIVNDVLADDGITLDVNMETGPTLEHVVFNYRTATESFNDLSELVGFMWYIDYSKVLHFFSRAHFEAPFSITTDMLYRSLTKRRTREQYRNTQWIRAGKDISSPLTESFHGDGTPGKQTTFTVALPIALEPTITLNSVVQTLGVRNVDQAGFQWYWNADDPGISQDPDGTPLTLTDTLTIVYQGFFPILIQSYTQSAIDERISVEGGSGIYEAIEDHEEINRSVLATDYALGLLRRFGHIPIQLDIETDQVGLRAGQLLPVSLARYGLNGDFLVQSVMLKDFTGDKLRYTISAVDGEPFGTWQEFFRGLAATGKPFLLRENEVLMLLRNFPETVNVGEVFAVATPTQACAQVGDVINFSSVCLS